MPQPDATAKEPTQVSEPAPDLAATDSSPPADAIEPKRPRTVTQIMAAIQAGEAPPTALLTAIANQELPSLRALWRYLHVKRDTALQAYSRQPGPELYRAAVAAQRRQLLFSAIYNSGLPTGMKFARGEYVTAGETLTYKALLSTIYQTYAEEITEIQGLVPEDQHQFDT
ncbi:MAG TPA: hypothetical protein VKQ30_25010 [Ktedonobacterales bacterium]|nr:hypothetical protein [Ktedonobacterales bacterium]